MARVSYQDSDGFEEVVDVPAGMSIMAAAVAEGVDGIVAECGGNAMCATCHVYLAAESQRVFPEPTDYEDAMLEDAASPRLPNSRLSCQLVIAEDMPDIVVTLPPEQL
jgi:2Fe-2S ferredoxin